MHKQTKRVLSVSTDAKTVKGKKLGILTGVLYLAPAKISGFEVCAKRSDGCTKACLYTSGRGAFNNVQASRINKTRWFFEDRASFMARIVADIEYVERRAEREGLTPAIRLNGTSDLPWEKIRCVRDGVEYRNVMLAFPHIQFYDYTKIPGRTTAINLPNYHLTFSLAENNDDDAFTAIEQGYNVAVVLNLKKTADKPKTWNGYPVVDGDDSDVRFFDPKGGHVVALTAKGAARKDTTGFVRDANIIARG